MYRYVTCIINLCTGIINLTRNDCSFHTVAALNQILDQSQQWYMHIRLFKEFLTAYCDIQKRAYQTIFARFNPGPKFPMISIIVVGNIVEQYIFFIQLKMMNTDTVQPV